MAFQRRDGVLLQTKFTNCSTETLSEFTIQFNVNYFALALIDSLDIG